MEIILKSIGDKGDLNNERIGFNVLTTCELKYFLVIRTKKNVNGFHNKGTDYFWFLPQQVKANDKVVLYTRSGQNSVNENSDGSKTFFFYWGLTSPIFNNADDIVVLANIKNWTLS
jgi:hypothetical protein